MARKKSNSEGGGDSWLNTYADMVTLLLTFFALLISMSSINEDKFNALVQALGNLPEETIEAVVNGQGKDNGEGGIAFGDTNETTAIDELYKYLKKYVDGSDQGAAIDISAKDGVIYIRFRSDFYFEPNKYILKKESLPSLSFIADGIKTYEEQIKMINICGHTANPKNDNIRISEWMLSGERAAAVAVYFQEEKKIDSSKMIVLGYGHNYPVAPNDSEENMRKNRRVELVIVGKDSKFDMSSMLGGEYNKDEYPTEGGADDLLVPPNSINSPKNPEEPQKPQSDSNNTQSGDKNENYKEEETNAQNSNNENTESTVSPYDDNK